MKKQFLIYAFLLATEFLFAMEMDFENYSKSDLSQPQLFGTSQCNSTPANLDTLPPEIISIIIGYLANIGTSGFINVKDIPVIIKNIHNLADVNKQLYANIHSNYVTNALIYSLSARFEKLPIDIAVLIKTKGAQNWLKEYVQKSGDYELFKVVQRIFTICREIHGQMKEIGTDLGDGQKGSNPFYYQTNQGLMLKSGSYSHSLLTPWGEVRLFGSGCGSYLGFLAAQQEFLKRITAYFEAIPEPSFLDRAKVNYYELEKEIDLDNIGKLKFKDIFKKISFEEVKTKNGQKTLITSDYCGYDAIYKMRAVGDTVLPDPELLSDQEYRSYEAIKAIWEIMDNQFHNRPKKSKKRATLSFSYKREPRIYPVPYTVTPSSKLNTIQDVPAYCIELVQKLQAQPFFTGQGGWHENDKVLTCESWDDCRIVEMLTSNANESLDKETQWHIRTFGCGNSQMYINDQCLGDGLQLWTYENNTPCSLDILKNQYETIINKLKQGWYRSTLIENKDILHTQSEEEWFYL